MIHVAFFDRFDAWVTTSVLIAAMLCAWWVGWWGGQRRRIDGREPPAEKLGEASFAMFALLLAFAFGMAMQKHENRRQMVVADANAIGDFYTCAGLLREPLRDKLQGVIRNYTHTRLKARQDINSPTLKQDLQKLALDTNAMSDLVREAGESGSPFTVPLANTLNELTSAEAAALSALDDRNPTLVIVLVIMTAITSIGLAGWRHGAVGTPQRLAPIFIIATYSMMIFVILDLDTPTHGLIQVSPAPMERLVASMEK